MTSPDDPARTVAPPAEPADVAVALASGPAHDRGDWEKAAAGVLRKSGRMTADDPDELVWEKLTRSTLDGIAVTPLGTPESAADLRTTGRPERAGDWDVRAWFAEPDAKAAADAIQVDLDNGVTSLWLEVGAAGLPVDALGTALAGVLLDVAPVVLEPSDPVSAAEAFAELARRVSTGSTTGLAEGTNLGADPLGALVRGIDAGDVADTVTSVAAIARDLGCRALVVDGTAVHDLGASDVQELGWTLAVAAAYLRTMTDAGVDLDDATRIVEFRYAATDEQFTTIAKLRAARRLWARMLELSGADAGGVPAMRIHAVTSRPMMTKYDPWVNMLRTCVAAFAAGVGGADAVTVLPFDVRLGLPEAFGRRIARNTSALLIHESHVARVADPGGGAYAIEKLTDDLAVAAWEELGRIEGAGGAERALRDGSLQERIDDVVRQRDVQVARRKRPITGLSEFPNLAETLPERRAQPDGTRQVRPYGHAFEELRDEPVEPKVFLATMGTVASHTARATFATNLFAAGGIGVVNPGRADDVEAVLAAYDGQPVVCLTGADAAYAAWGAELVTALRGAGARWVILAGKAPDFEVDDTCAMGVDALDFLRRTRERLA